MAIRGRVRCSETPQLFPALRASRPSPQAATNRARGHRRGVILLVLLGVLALFGATAFAYVAVASHANRIARSLDRIDQRKPLSPQQELESALLQIVRGPQDSNTSSVLRRHSLLEDIYGGNESWIRGWVINGFTLPLRGSGVPSSKRLHPIMVPATPMPSGCFADVMAGGQIIEFTAGYSVPQHGPVGGLVPLNNASATGGIYASETLTVPTWFGTAGRNYAGLTPVRNDPVEFNRRVGAVLTVVDSDSPMFKKSTRIVGYRRVEVPDKATRMASDPPLPIDVIYHLYQILPFEGVSAENTREHFSDTEYSGADYVINGTPFSGRGAGYDASTGRNSGVYAPLAGFELPYALLPNTTDPEYHANLATYSANEDYDAPDYQNMLLAMEQTDGGDGVLTRSPSLHRPALANYWMSHILQSVSAPTLGDKLRLLIQPYGRDGARSTADEDLIMFPLELRDAIVTIKRRCLLRPISELHYAFDGSNPNWPSFVGEILPQGNKTPEIMKLEVMVRQAWGVADLKPGETAPWIIDPDGDGIPNKEVIPWDVDNDGDGISDSIWVDIGLPVRASPTGYLCRPLVAIHCIDLDGKLNLNTAGSVEELYPARRHPLRPTASNGYPSGYLNDGTVYAQELKEGCPPTALVDLPRGQGCGTAEIGLLPLFGFSSYYNYRNLLLGMRRDRLDGRNGEMESRRPAPEYHVPAPGKSHETDSPERLMMSRLLGFPANYWEAVANARPTGYGSPMDLKGTLTVGLDLFGQPIYSPLRGVNVGTNPSGWVTGWNFDAWNLAHLDTPYELKLGSAATQSNAALDNPFTVAEFERLLRPYDVDYYSLPRRLEELLHTGPSSYYKLRATTESWDLPVPNLSLPQNLRDALPVLPKHTTDMIAAKLLDLHTNHRDTLPSTTYFYPEPMNVDNSTLLSTDVLSGLRLDLNRPFGDGKDNDANFIVDEPNEPDDEATNYRHFYARSLYILMMALVAPDWYPEWDEQIQAKEENAEIGALRAEARARAIAQWAINIVDFRDPDSMMTPFAYDVYPFAVDGSAAEEFPEGIDRDTNLRGKLLNTWNVDGPDRRVVWGCERPELLITETLAFHDRRTEDAGDDPTGKFVEEGDNDFDQRYPPEGSLFVELYNPWTDAEPGPSEFHCSRKTGDDAGGVILNQLTRRGRFGREQNPVWRLVVTKGTDGTPCEYVDPNLMTGGHYPNWSESPDAGIERIVYFVPETESNVVLPDRLPPNSTRSPWVTFFPSHGADVVVEPHHYSVIGPGAETRDAVGATTSGVTYVGESDDPANTRRIELSPTAAPRVRVYGDGTTDDLKEIADAICPPTAVLIDQIATKDAPAYRRLSVSEPVEGYAPAKWDLAELAFKYDPPLDRPEDKMHDGRWREGTIFNNDATTPAYRYIHLQRLANPEVPHDPDANPYLTIDTSSVDLTVFNGRDSRDDAEIEPGTWAFNSRQRGEDNGALWAVKLPGSDDMPQAPGTPRSVARHVFAEPFDHTLGYVNSHFGQPLDPTVFPLPAYRGAPGSVGNSDDHSGKCFRPNPFAWLTWLNRPFANPLELMQVPATRSSRLLVSYENNAMGVPDLQPYQSGQAPFGHLLSFFSALPGHASSGQMKGVPTEDDEDASPSEHPASHLYRFFEYVHVPSRFIDSHIHTDPELMDDSDEPHAFHPPYNHISTYREPGKINLDTIFGTDGSCGEDSIVWWGLVNDRASVSYSLLELARRACPGDRSDFEPNAIPLPTRFANPFRSFAGADLVPPVPGRDPEEDDTLYLGQTIQEGVNATLLRSAVGLAGPLEPLDRRQPLFSVPTVAVSAAPAKSPFFQYQSLQRLSNLTTTRSNVYAVWMTLGYFYVIRHPVYDPGNALHRQLYGDGYILGKEVGIHDGTAKRHRAFSVVDRSIPVGFIPGENLNTEKAILVRRFIE